MPAATCSKIPANKIADLSYSANRSMSFTVVCQLCTKSSYPGCQVAAVGICGRAAESYHTVPSYLHVSLGSTYSISGGVHSVCPLDTYLFFGYLVL